MKDPNETQEFIPIELKRNSSVSPAKTLGSMLDSLCDGISRILKPLPMSMKVLISAGIAYAITDGAIYFDTGKHIHRHAKEYYEKILDAPSQIFRNM
jgi:hypothetical protein